MRFWTTHFLMAHDGYLYAATAMLGTFAAAWLLIFALHRKAWAPFIASLHGVAPPFINMVGVLFGLTLAFIANDAWTAHDQAAGSVRREADALRSLLVVATQLPAEQGQDLRGRVGLYAQQALAEWPVLALRSSSPAAAGAADALLASLAGASSNTSLQSLMLGQALKVREARETRIALSQTQINPLKWFGMAFLGFITLLTVAVAHIGAPRAAAVAIALFAIAAAPTAAIVLIQGNPFERPGAVSPAPLQALLATRP